MQSRKILPLPFSLRIRNAIHLSIHLLPLLPMVVLPMLPSLPCFPSFPPSLSFSSFSPSFSPSSFPPSPSPPTLSLSSPLQIPPPLFPTAHPTKPFKSRSPLRTPPIALITLHASIVRFFLLFRLAFGPLADFDIIMTVVVGICEIVVVGMVVGTVVVGVDFRGGGCVS